MIVIKQGVIMCILLSKLTVSDFIFDRILLAVCYGFDIQAVRRDDSACDGEHLYYYTIAKEGVLLQASVVSAKKLSYFVDHVTYECKELAAFEMVEHDHNRWRDAVSTIEKLQAPFHEVVADYFINIARTNDPDRINIHYLEGESYARRLDGELFDVRIQQVSVLMGRDAKVSLFFVCNREAAYCEMPLGVDVRPHFEQSIRDLMKEVV